MFNHSKEMFDSHLAQKFAGIRQRSTDIQPQENQSLGQIYLVGHGRLEDETDYTFLPPKTRITFYTGLNCLLADDLRNAVLTGDFCKNQLSIATARFSMDAPKLPIPSYAYDFPQTASGESMQVPNYTLKPFTAKQQIIEDRILGQLKIKSGQIISVETETKLSTLLKQYKGYDLHWLACAFLKHKNSSSLIYQLKSPAPETRNDQTELQLTTIATDEVRSLRTTQQKR